ncbi:MAG: iron ABC transporter permease [Candidatus Altiarchaeales archaeon]|nr:iron ABC transporter permease [Candidatus Altiarchaeales archaeon]
MVSGLGLKRWGKTQIICLIALLFFIFVIFLPPVYVLSYAFKSSFVLNESSKIALFNSLLIGGVVTIFDLLLGLPVAWVLAKRKHMHFRFLIDTLIDMPLVVPTSILGLSVFYFWNDGMGSLLGLEGGLISKGPLLITLLHFVFTFPYVVRSIEAAILQIDATHEQAATMLGASPLTVFRTISLPLFKAGLISGAILAYTRSLSETGATMMVSGFYSTAPTIVVDYKTAGDIHSAAAISVVLIGIAVILLVLTKLLSASFRVPMSTVWPSEERMLSRKYVKARDILVSLLVFLVILLPTFYIVLSRLDVVKPETILALAGDSMILESIFVSFVVGLIVTAVNLMLAIPLGILISKNMFKLGNLVDTMGDVILLVPTSALGLSLSLFWKNFSLNEFLVLVLAHLSFTFPLMVKPIAASLTGVDPHLEDAARTLGANSRKVFRTIVYPLIKPGILAGLIMTFMRSLSETGATMSVSGKIKTIPVLLVELFNKGGMDDNAVLACITLFAVSFAFILALKKQEVNNAQH